ncbi:MAG: glycosyltransferase family 39 protein [Candidatus Promineifilaceae bacterium]|nr:glycosyltransferase family 39 protein [Candidatus Promineifilaceae bacterium]
MMGTRTLNRKGWLWPAAVAALAFALRLINLGGRPIWYDEAFSVLFGEKSLATMFAGTVTPVDGAAADVHPLFYYSILHGWMALWGQSPAAVRLLSVLIGVATVVVSYLLGRRLFGRNAGLAAAVITALAPFHVYYSQEARMYALLGLAALATTLFLVRAWGDGGWPNWVAFAVSGAVTMYAHNLGALFVAALALWILYAWWRARRPVHLRSLLLSHLLMALLFSPWLLIVPSQLGKIEQAYWVTRPGITEIVQTLLIFHFAYDNQALPPWLLPPVLLLSLLILALLALELARRRPAVDPDRFSHPYALLLFLTAGPPLLAFLISQVRPIYIVRALLPSALIYYVLVGGVLVAGRTPRVLKWGIWLPALAIAALSLFNHYTYAGFPRAPFDQAAAFLRADGDSAAIVHSNKLTFLPTHYRDRALPQSFIADEPGSPADTLAPPTQQALGISATADLETAVGEQDRVYLVLFEQAREEFTAAGREHPHLEWMREHYRPADVHTFGDLLIYEFAAPPS